MRRITGIVIFVLGLLILCLGFAKVLTGAAGTGGFLMFVGLVAFGLSFIKQGEVQADAPAPMSPFERITRVFYEPKAVFENLHFHPRWVAGFAVIAICSVIYHVAFVQRVGPEVIALAPIEKTIESGIISADRADQVKERALEAARSPVARVTGPLSEVAGIFLWMCFLAAVLMVLAMIFGGRLTYWQAVCVAIYSSLPVFVVTKLVSLILLYVKARDDIDPIKGRGGLVRADLGILFSPTDHPYLYVLGGFIGLLTLYGLWLEATGLRYAGEKISSASAWAIALLLLVVFIVLALIGAALFPSFVT